MVKHICQIYLKMTNIGKENAYSVRYYPIGMCVHKKILGGNIIYLSHFVCNAMYDIIFIKLLKQ